MRRKEKKMSIPLLSKLMNVEINDSMSLLEFACIIGAKKVIKKLIDHYHVKVSIQSQYSAFMEEDILSFVSLDSNLNNKKRKFIE